MLRDRGVSPTKSRSPHRLKRLSFFCVVFSLAASIFLFALDNTIVTDVQGNVILSLGGIEKLPWISVAFTLGSFSTILSWRQLYCYFDNKWLFISAVVLFEAGSAVCGAAPTLDALIVGRAICGIGGIGCYIGTMNMISALTNEVERPIYLASIGLLWGSGTVLGPIIGGVFADSSATCRWAFYINFCVGGAAAPVYLFLLPSVTPPAIEDLRFTVRVKRLDIIGVIIDMGASATLIMAISFGGGVYAWNSGQIIALFVCTGVLWIAFVLQQRFSLFTSPQNRLFPITLLKSRDMNILFAQMASIQNVVFIPIYFIPIYFQFAKGFTALDGGIQLLPSAFLLVFAIMLNGAMMANALLYTIGLETGKAQIYGQVGGITIALTLSNTIFLNRSTDRVATILPETARATIQQAILGSGSAFFNNLSLREREQVLTAIIKSIADTYILAITAAAFCLVLSLFMKRERLFGGSTPPTIGL
ncbi:MFS general substrate transporter [Bimuria novae-zelandiae CBS 107.79]|uniref:MFS general substrate transporter n=1 Tax=Bimuria novae-zelandiae CBS 107.79 TaxID=1447943 RepID=A0A6A5UUH9_9PLEO|nr:MFS general substrate transporter [Bimuria novae-zelandiae CBS 107.79]